MARDFSTKLLHSYKFPHLPHLHAIVKAAPAIQRVRRVQRRLAPTRAHPYRGDNLVTAAFDAASEHYQVHGWAYLEGVFEPEFHRALVEQWPKRRYLSPPTGLAKSYDVGFKWLRGQPDPAFLPEHPCIEAVFRDLCGADFGSRMTAFMRSPEPISCYSFLLNHTYPGSVVIPHLDETISPEAPPFLNIVVFVNGSGGERSGGLAITRDNEGKDVIFEPVNLVNTCLVYDTKAPFYHGFAPVKWGKFRWAITANFCASRWMPPAGRRPSLG